MIEPCLEMALSLSCFMFKAWVSYFFECRPLSFQHVRIRSNVPMTRMSLRAITHSLTHTHRTYDTQETDGLESSEAIFLHQIERYQRPCSPETSLQGLIM